MEGPERRQTTRTTINGLGYVNFGPDNGGIVLNVSEGGLCFHSVAPIQRNGAIPFWFPVRNHRIEAEGELAWVNGTQKTGGLRFTALPAEGREEIRNWINQATMRLGANEASARSVPPPRPSPNLSASRPDTNAAPGRSTPLTGGSPGEKVSTSLTGFSRGLATGLLVSALVAVPFLFHTYRRQFGDLLIHLGEQLAAKSQAQTQRMSPAPQTVLPALRPSLPGPIPVSPQEKLLLQPLTIPAKPQQTKLEPTRSASASTSVANDSAHKTSAVADAPAISSTPPAISLPTTVAPNSNVISDATGTVPQHEPADHPGVHGEASREENAGSNSGKYFEVGKFKDDLWAHKATDKLEQLGFRATVTQKGHLWMKSYYVLVGPYGDHEDAEEARKNLVSRGFKPRLFERGSRTFTFHSGLTLNGTRVPGGDYIVSWESYSPDARVEFVQGDYIVATADGRWVKRDVRYQHDAYVYRRNGDGSRTLLEIRFAGMSQALVFG
jgi:cell division septation protein DedD